MDNCFGAFPMGFARVFLPFPLLCAGFPSISQVGTWRFDFGRFPDFLFNFQWITVFRSFVWGCARFSSPLLSSSPFLAGSSFSFSWFTSLVLPLGSLSFPVIPSIFPLYSLYSPFIFSPYVSCTLRILTSF